MCLECRCKSKNQQKGGEFPVPSDLRKLAQEEVDGLEKHQKKEI